MCRFLAYLGEPVFLNELVCAPTHSLVHQSLHATEAKTETNGDGFGIGWYGERREPGIYRDISPAWSDENLVNLCSQVKARAFFAHVRASTGTATTRANCHPFAHGRHLFMHNGQIGGYHRIKRRLEALIPDELYDSRRGTTDSEAIFLLALANGLAEDPVGAMEATFATVHDLMHAAKVTEPLRFTALLTDGRTLTAFRWACDGRPPSLYYRESEAGIVVVSEPIDGCREGWTIVPKGGTLQVTRGRPAIVTKGADTRRIAA
ncbi:class II glutamine amidotransferase [Methylobacterium haplocladii]|uniref:Class II glutamine amidotransferase n=1 Tax=Methylobacterium haplocladii TaxID=1176176 RepID=A0A512IRZ8_9HYPH|nr:class II glutamine amidotransferase [Methylobacterium haplocladii]GEP00480.1 class II glutamine amidotransferase [Methylobacterium haplocladii]GJD82499.1 Gamma-glutamyl-hercynylcysteine sulfoxide hydrolase [Methylobacterium haplocladii]GLS59583.1 class II glutamine amidotransferase [Methylobacterium haplocladii]